MLADHLSRPYPFGKIMGIINQNRMMLAKTAKRINIFLNLKIK